MFVTTDVTAHVVTRDYLDTGYDVSQWHTPSQRWSSGRVTCATSSAMWDQGDLWKVILIIRQVHYGLAWLNFMQWMCCEVIWWSLHYSAHHSFKEGPAHHIPSADIVFNWSRSSSGAVSITTCSMLPLHCQVTSEAIENFFKILIFLNNKD